MPTSMPNATITFPMLGDKFQITAAPFFNIGKLEIHWYGIIIALGFLLAIWYGVKNSRRFGLDFDTIIDLLIWDVPLSIIGARIYFVIFHYDIYRDNFWDVFKVWNGGLGFYGALIATVITISIFCKVRKIKIGALLDFAAPGLLIGQSVGRWGNFMNREAFGVETDVFCRMGLTNPGAETIFVHPAFLYESLWNALGFLLIYTFIRKGKRKYDGQIFAMYLAWYGAARFMIESVRTDSLYLFSTGIRVSQLVGGLCIIGAIIYLAVNGSRKHDESKLFVNVVNAQEEAEAASEEDNKKQ